MLRVHPICLIAAWLVAYDGRVVMSLAGIFLVLPLCCLKRMRSVRTPQPYNMRRTLDSCLAIDE